VIHIRRAGPLDAPGLAKLLNQIITKGGTTAITGPVITDELQSWMAREKSIWHLAEDTAGHAMGFQWIQPHAALPNGTTDIATFVKLGETGLGIGSALFDATKMAARGLGCRNIDAIIRADNPGGLAYYQSRGFEDYRFLQDMALNDGTRVDKVWKRYRL
jgi:L-amino acid N-acyltransferase YncA